MRANKVILLFLKKDISHWENSRMGFRDVSSSPEEIFLQIANYLAQMVFPIYYGNTIYSFTKTNSGRGEVKPCIGHQPIEWEPDNTLKSPVSRLFTQLVVQAQIKKTHQSTMSLAFVRGIRRHNEPATRKMLPVDDVFMIWMGGWRQFLNDHISHDYF